MLSKQQGVLVCVGVIVCIKISLCDPFPRHMFLLVLLGVIVMQRSCVLICNCWTYCLEFGKVSNDHSDHFSLSVEADDCFVEEESMSLGGILHECSSSRKELEE